MQGVAKGISPGALNLWCLTKPGPWGSRDFSERGIGERGTKPV